MTQSQAIKQFRASLNLHLGESVPRDKPAIGEAWCNYIDHLVKSGQVKESTAKHWGNPFNA